MLINTGWLLDYVSPRPTAEQLHDALLAMGLEVEESRPLREELQDIRIGFVRSKEPLPDSDGMYVCQVDVAEPEMLQIVCAAKFPLEVGWGVPVAVPRPPSSDEAAEGPAAVRRLLSGIAIQRGRFRGVESEGMICADSELGLLAGKEDLGLHVFRDEALRGKSLGEVLAVDDEIIDVKVLANRADWMGLIGVAREVAAFRNSELVLPDAPAFEYDKSARQTVQVRVENPELCPRYMCGLIRGVKVGPSPPWLASRLTSLGLTTRNNVVDITNFVMREWGQPLHAFDYQKLSGGEIVVRTMNSGERLELLDGEIISGKEAPLVIADAEKTVALAGIKGGLATGTAADTVDILLEAAYFEPVSIRRNVKRLMIDPEDPAARLRPTDSSKRFERGTDPNFMLEGAFRRAVSLIIELAGGKLTEPPIDVYPQKIEPEVIRITPERASSFLGTPVDAATIKDGLERLEMKVSGDGEVTVPTWRVDARHPVVLIEDVARLIGYNTIEAKASPLPASLGRRCAADRLREEVSRSLVACGFLECRNPPLVPESVLAPFQSGATRGPVRMKNPMAEFEVLRTTLLPGLLSVAEASAGPDVEAFRFFEVDRVFRPANETIDERVENWSVGCLLGGNVEAAVGTGKSVQMDFFHAKGIVENLLDLAGAKGVRFIPETLPGYLPGQTAVVHLDRQPIGIVGTVDPAVLGKSKIRVALLALELNISSLVASYDRMRMAGKLATKPPVTRDLAVIVKQRVSYAELTDCICAAAGDLLDSVSCLDVYEGKQVPAGHKSLAVSMHFRDPEDVRTLDSETVDATIQQIIGSLSKSLGAELRT